MKLKYLCHLFELDMIPKLLFFCLFIRSTPETFNSNTLLTVCHVNLQVGQPTACHPSAVRGDTDNGKSPALTTRPLYQVSIDPDH